jgi:hypothetical protein
MNLIQIVPGLPPRIDGIGDYSLVLARRLAQDHGIRTSFIVADPAWRGGELPEFPATAIRARSAEQMIAAIEAAEASDSGVLAGGAAGAPVLLQLAVYGYQKRGCPFWLAQALERWSAGHPGRLQLAIHELEVQGSRPWSSTFWVPPVQRGLLKRIVRLGAFRYTNTEDYRCKLERWGLGEVALIPNFSTLGEPDANPPFAQRRREVVIFGRAAQRQWSYERGSDALAAVCRALGAERIVDIGEPLPGNALQRVGEVPIVAHGLLPAEQVCARMAGAIASFMEYPVALLTKSSVHAVSCAHGTIPFVFDARARQSLCPPLAAGEDFIPVDSAGVSLPKSSLEELSGRVFRNYQARASRAAAATVAQSIRASA